MNPGMRALDVPDIITLCLVRNQKHEDTGEEHEDTGGEQVGVAAPPRVGVASPSLSPLAVISVESQLSCSPASTEDAAAALLEAEAAAALLVDSAGVSDSDVVFVHWRAFFYQCGEDKQGSAGVLISMYCIN